VAKPKYKIVRLDHIKVEQAFDREAELLKQIQNGSLSQCLLLWRPADQTVVLPASKKWLAHPELVTQLHTSGWDIVSRRTGGAPVPQNAGVINVSHIYLWDHQEPYSTGLAYQALCRALGLFFQSYGLEVDIHATPSSYCDGDYNLNINGQKIVGTAQRVMMKSNQEKIVLAQACILIEADFETLVQPVNLCNRLNQNGDLVSAAVHTSLAQHLGELPTTEALFQRMVQAFVVCQNT